MSEIKKTIISSSASKNFYEIKSIDETQKNIILFDIKTKQEKTISFDRLNFSVKDGDKIFGAVEKNKEENFFLLEENQDITKCYDSLCDKYTLFKKGEKFCFMLSLEDNFTCHFVKSTDMEKYGIGDVFNLVVEDDDNIKFVLDEELNNFFVLKTHTKLITENYYKYMFNKKINRLEILLKDIKDKGKVKKYLKQYHRLALKEFKIANR